MMRSPGEFYAFCLKVTGKERPGAEEVIAKASRTVLSALI